MFFHIRVYVADLINKYIENISEITRAYGTLVELKAKSF
jgi:hypothetical protein